MPGSTQRQLEFRKATIDDVDVAKQLGKAAIFHQCRSHYSPEHLAAWTAEPYPQTFSDNVVRYLYLALLDGRVVGTGGLILPEATIDGIFVQPDYMGRGIGTAMMKFLEALAVKNGLTAVNLDSTLNAVSFYVSLGFTCGEPKKYITSHGVELDCMPMQKVLGR